MHTLRPYQEECVSAIRRNLAVRRSTLAVLATGLGKTVIFSNLASEWTEGRVLVLAHREELVDQAKRKIWAETNEEPFVEMGKSTTDMQQMFYGSHVVIGSVPTLCRPKRQKKFRPEDFGLVITDEAHHATGNSYKAVYEHFFQNPNCKHLGVTATPNRSDEIALGSVFDSVAFNYGIEEAVDDAWLVPIHQRFVYVQDLDFSKVRTVTSKDGGKDLDPTELDRILTEEKHLHSVAAPTIEMAGDRLALIFCVSVNHAKLLADVLNRYKPNSAEYLCGESEPGFRKDTVKRFREGGLQFLCNCGLFLEGFDAPETAMVVMARPTKSLVLYIQVLGRGTRPLPGIVDGLGLPAERSAAIANSAKAHMIVLDFVGNSGRHKLISSIDVLGGKWPDEVKERAKGLANQGVDVTEAGRWAEDELSLLEEETVREQQDRIDNANADRMLREEEDERRRRITRQSVKGEAKYFAREVSPFAAGDREPARDIGTGQRVPPTNSQIWKLGQLGVDRETARGYSKKQASAVIGKLMKKRGADA